MDIIQARREDRIRRIAQIKASILQAENPDYKLLIMKCCSEWGIAERTIKEYVKVAKWQIEDELQSN